MSDDTTDVGPAITRLRTLEAWTSTLNAGITTDADRGRMASIHRCASCQGWVTLAVEYEVYPFGPEPARVWGDDVPCRTCGAIVTIEEHRPRLEAAARGFVTDFWK